MPRAGQLKPESDRRLSDLVSVGVLTRAFPRDVVDGVIADAGAKEQRHRSLPAWVMAYYSMGMALYAWVPQLIGVSRCPNGQNR